MTNKLILFITALMLFSIGCTHSEMAYLNKDYFFKETGVTVATCPAGAELLVNDIICITPCKINLPYDTPHLTVIHENKIARVQVARSGYHDYTLHGTLLIPNLNKLDITSNGPEAPIFIRDTLLGMSDFCGY